MGAVFISLDGRRLYFGDPRVRLSAHPCRGVRRYQRGMGRCTDDWTPPCSAPGGSPRTIGEGAFLFGDNFMGSQTMLTPSSILQARRWYAEEFRYKAKVSSPALVDAFATVHREDFVGRGPWRFLSPMNAAEYWTSDDADPRHVYHDVLIALDEERGINNGLPSLWAYLFDHVEIKTGDHVLHLGCGTGYYTAIAAELTGTAGSVTAIEIDPMLAEKARAALSAWHQVQVRNQDGAQTAFEPVDV